MHEMTINLLLDDATYEKVQAGLWTIGGMALDNGHRVRKHIPTVKDAVKDNAGKALELVANHKGKVLVAAGAAAAGTAIGYFLQRDKRKSKKRVKKALREYIDVAKNGTLTVEVLDELIAALDQARDVFGDAEIPVNLDAQSVMLLMQSIYDYTKRMAEVNQVNPDLIIKPQFISDGNIVDLRYYLHTQKTFMEQPA